MYLTKKKFPRALFMQLVLGGILIVIKLLQSIIFTRLVIPEEFGVFVTSLLIVNMFALFGNFDLQKFVIKEKSRFSHAIGGSFLITFVFNFLLFLALNFFSPVISLVFGDPKLAYFVKLLSPLIFMNVVLVLNSQWEKQMKFGTTKLMNIFGSLIGITTTLISFYTLNLGLLSLFYGSLAGFFALFLISVIFLPRKSIFSFDIIILKEMLLFGLPLLISSILGFVLLRWDDFAIRFFWGDSALALYTVAFYLPMFALEVVELVNKLLFVSFSNVISSKEKVLFLFEKSNKYISIIVVPLGVLTSVFSPWIIKFLFGDNWLPAIPLMQIFALSFLLRGSLAYSWSLIPISKGNTNIILLGSLGNAIMMVIFGTIFIYFFGVLGGVLINLMILIFWTIPFRFYVIKKELGNLNFLKGVIKPFISGAFMGLFAFSFLWLIIDLLTFFILATSSFILYFVILFILDKKTIINDIKLMSVFKES